MYNFIFIICLGSATTPTTGFQNNKHCRGWEVAKIIVVSIEKLSFWHAIFLLQFCQFFSLIVFFTSEYNWLKIRKISGNMRVSVLIWSSESFLYEPLSNQYGQPVRIFGFLSNCKSFSWEMEYYFVQRFIWISMWVVKRNVIAYFKHSCNMRGCLSVIFIPGVIGSFRFLKAIGSPRLPGNPTGRNYYLPD